MALDEAAAEAVRFLLRRTEGAARARVCGRLGIDPDGPVGPWPGIGPDGRFRQTVRQAPASVRFWLLQADDPEVNRVLFEMGALPRGLTWDLMEGLPFGGAAGGRVRRRLTGPSPQPVRSLPALLAVLREQGGTRSLRRARAAADELRTAAWPVVLSAHRAEPFPGFARWALAERPDCPVELRELFGDHAKYRNRLRAAGILDSLAVPARTWRAADALPVLGMAARAVPERLAEVEAELASLVRSELGGHPEAWAVLARLLGESVATPPELIVLAGALAGPDPDPGR
ncbi:hypothetical protein [Kitasatospora sp. NPDC088346]|uniref:hypothetical protein n=1 Tax=Kitasatospora sp. NPDC088346 TaxID=3364073 RepID=UPI00381DC4EC